MKAKIVFVFVYLSIFQANGCVNHKTCGDCLLDPKDCVWCASNIDAFDPNMERCQPKRSYDGNWCQRDLEIRTDPKSSIPESCDRNFSLDVQIKPQKYDVTLLPGQEITLNFSFQGAKNYPVDVYLLADMSDTMKSYRQDVADASRAMHATLHRLTNNIRLGFGAFVDKNTFPYVTHYLDPTTDVSEFIEALNQENGENYDLPEGGFDALAQVLACESEIGWRKKARRIVVFLSNAPQHVVGHGHTAAIHKPYDGECHTVNKEYTQELHMDYPSVHQINKLATDKAVTIIWTVPDRESQWQLYSEVLTKNVKGSKAASLDDESIDKHLHKIYEEISTNLIIDTIVQSGHQDQFEISFEPDCTKSDAKNTMKKKDCMVKPENQLNFTVNIKLKEYYKRETETIDLSFEGVDEKLTLNIAIDGGCACKENRMNISTECNGQALECGVCDCGLLKYGQNCKCDKEKETVTDDDNALDESCIAPNAPHREKCSGHPDDCVCGKCHCTENRRGTYCQQDFSRCPGYRNGTVCNNHGTCRVEAGLEGDKYVCYCDKGWKHPPGQEDAGCTCSDAEDACISNDTKCNNRGRCVCNTCICDDKPQWDKRVKHTANCEMISCPECHSLQCDALRACVLCHLDQDDCDNVCAAGINVNKNHTEIPQKYLISTGTTEWQLCNNQKVASCYTKFVYKYDKLNHEILVLIEKNKTCAQEYYLYGGILLLTLLLVGIFTLLAWKCLTRYQDRKEYEKFEREHKSVLSSPCTNPLYSEPRTFFRNPAFVASINE